MPQPTHHPRQPDSVRQLDVYRTTLELIRSCQVFRGRHGRFNRRLGAQLTESLAPRAQNLAEGMRRTGKDRAHLLTVQAALCLRSRGKRLQGHPQARLAERARSTQGYKDRRISRDTVGPIRRSAPG